MEVISKLRELNWIFRREQGTGCQFINPTKPCFFKTIENSFLFISSLLFRVMLLPLKLQSLGQCNTKSRQLCLAPGPLLGPRPWPWPLICIYRSWPKFVFTGPGPQFLFTGLGPQFVFTWPGTKFVFTSPGPQFVFTNPGPQFVFTGSDPQFVLTPNLYLPAQPRLSLHILTLSPQFVFTGPGL